MKEESQSGEKKERRVGVDFVKFEYKGRDDEHYRTRTVSVYATDDKYIEGFCHLRNRSRTFLLERIKGDIVSLLTGEIKDPAEWAGHCLDDPLNGIVRAGQVARANPPAVKAVRSTTVVFTGFDAASRADMEDLARAAGWEIRKSVSSALSYLVAGPNAGPAKLKAARAGGTEVLSSMEFWRMVK